MSALEERLRAELRAESELVTGESIRPLDLPGQGSRQRVPDRGAVARSRLAWLTPVAAAAAMAAVVGGTLTASYLIGTGPGSSHGATPYSALPSYYAATVAGDVVSYRWKGTQYSSSVLGRSIELRATGSGQLIATLSPPGDYNDFAVMAGSADGRTFVFGAERYWGFRGPANPLTGALDASAPVRFVILRIGPGGRHRLAALPLPFVVLPGQQPSIALSPDGTRLAVTYGGDGHDAVVRVVDLATGEQRQWQWPHVPWTPLLQGPGAWTADGRTLVVQQFYVTGANGRTPEPQPPAGTSLTWLLDTAASGPGPQAGRLLTLRAPAGLGAPWQPFLTPDGNELIATVATRAGRPFSTQASGEFAVYSARTGELVSTGGHWRQGPRPGARPRGMFAAAAIAWSDSSGSRVLVTQPRGGANRLGVLTGGRVVFRSRLLPGTAEGRAQLQRALQAAYGIPPHMAW